MIQGVKTKTLIRHKDERGFFEEIIRVTDGFFKEGFAQLSHSMMQTGVVKAWHVHNTQVDWWYMVRGRIKVALYDTRDFSKTYKELYERTMSHRREENIVLKIPPGVAHGLKVLEGPADLVYITSKTYDTNEEGRIPYDDKGIDYDWVQGMEITNKNIT